MAFPAQGPDTGDPYTALILAGRRGSDDPLAAATGAPHRALLDVAGTPMLARVVRALEACDRVSGLTVSIDARELLAGVPELAARLDAGSLSVLDSESSPSRSVLAALDGLEPGRRLLVTTADHALLDAEMVSHFLDAADRANPDVAVGLVSASRLRARFPESKRTYLPFRGERYSGANLFAFRTARARRAAEFWTRAEAFRKRPLRLVSTFGIRALVLFALRRLDLAAAFEHASGVIGARVVAVDMPFAEAAIDVDRVADLELVNRILRERD